MFRVLVVDDEPMIRMGLAKLIAETPGLAAEVETAENGADALERIDRRPPDVLFTDIRMPRLDGLGLCRTLAERGSAIPLVIVSGYSDFEYARECLTYGVKDYLLKPVTRKAVHDTLGRLSAAPKRAEAYVPVFSLDQWAKQAADAIWSLRSDALETLLADWLSEVTAQEGDHARLHGLLREAAMLVADKLNSRDVYRFEPQWTCMRTGTTPSELTEDFAGAIRGLFAELRSKRGRKGKDPVEEAKLHVEAHLASDSSLEEVAEFLGMNASYFSQLFKQRTGETFVQFRTRRRIEKAKRLLEQPHIRIIDISYEVGYADHPYFTKIFKKLTGLSPSEYRHSLGIEG
ncbi:hypothetical protein J31TS4_05190 [Paenibacillus sp. J31TS4]|uniref:response regulator n=1 Tax=Paenibacillus sp. J31TS4 TaxID=2807195 RepID=UPI001B01E0BE|nr:response regulator [Paenibacillus sp. J31TS4]GIP37239.1 hypothetical protein J31TS4_05190 [Paenibacillus sp. J31TS4]